MIEIPELKKENQERKESSDVRKNPGFLIFGGTSEGRELAEYLSKNEIPATVCVATEYGEEVLREGLPGVRMRTGRCAEWPDGVEAWSLSGIRVRTGRMDEPEMEVFLREFHPLAVVDATHPYAEAVTENIRAACEKTGLAYHRLLRRETPLEAFDNLCIFDDCPSAADWLEGQSGNILLTTGMKELPEFAARLTDKSRIYARVLLQEDVFAQAERLGLVKKQMICMQGPFSKEMNVATLHMTGAAFLVTKESGKNGGFAEKAEAAAEAGAVCVVIRRPVEEAGNSLEEICEILLKLWKANSGNREILSELRNVNEEESEVPCNGKAYPFEPESQKAECLENEGMIMEENSSSAPETTSAPPKTISLVGIGMGGEGQMTLEAVNVCAHADCIIGARRMLESLTSCAASMVPLYKAEEIIEFIKKHPEHEHIVIALSGDGGFYSGAKQLLKKLADMPELGAYRVSQICGISSVNYFAARLKMPWQDMALVSMHGREQNLVDAVRTNGKVFVLASDAASIRTIAEKLANFGFGGLRMYVGADLSYPTERMDAGYVREFLNYGMMESNGYSDAEEPSSAEEPCHAVGSKNEASDRMIAGASACLHDNRPERKLCVAVIENPRAGEQIRVHGIPDSAFVRGKVPMTKEEVRSISVSKLQLTRDAVVYDIGAGTGSVAVECARMADRGKVYAVEWKEDAWKLIAKNRKRFAVSNLEIVAGRAPEALTDLPAPTHAFIGGSGGEMRPILKALFKKNPRARVVVNCITPETLGETLDAAPKIGFMVADIVSVSVAKAKEVGDYHMMMGQNPVYVITLTGGKTEDK